MIKVDHVSMSFNLASDKVTSIKEYFVRRIKHTLSYKPFFALNDISFEISKGEIVGIIGGNGAGKSTMLKIISGILSPTSGDISVGGTIAPMLELGAGFDMDLTAQENVFLNGAILGYSKSYLQERYEDILKFSELKDFMDVPLRNFSSGMMMRLAFSISTLVDPDILIVDEILAVGDAQFQTKCIGRLEELMNSGTTVLLVSHSLKQIRDMCTRVIWLEHGKMQMDGPSAEICEAYEKSWQAGR